MDELKWTVREARCPDGKLLFYCIYRDGQAHVHIFDNKHIGISLADAEKSAYVIAKALNEMEDN